jgi:hypothetical protein
MVNRFLLLFIVITIINLFDGCYYYKVNRSQDPPGPMVMQLQDENKFIILHHGDSAWHFTDVFANDKNISGSIFKLEGHDKYRSTVPEKANRYRKGGNKDESEVVNEVHIYTSELTLEELIRVTVPMTGIEKIEVYDPAVGATIASWVFGGLGIVAGTTAVVAVIIALIKESCPFIYVSDGESYKFIGEIYSGAIYPSLERHDYLPLPEPKQGQTDYNIKMTNEVHEIQHTNLIELKVFNHPAGTDVLLDKYGNYQTISDPQPPVEAVNLKGRNLLDIIREKDTLCYSGDQLGKDHVVTDGIVLKFKRPPDKDQAKLIVKAKNTFWLDYVFTRFHSLFGKEYDCWVEKQETVPDKRMKTWFLDQNIPLMVYIEKKGKWKFVDYYNIVGPMAAKEDVLALDLADIESETVKIKLEFGFFFWEIDYASIDFSTNVIVSEKTALFESAIDNKEKDVKKLLESPDLLYYVQPEIGDEVNMRFKIPEREQARQTFILHSKGYYKILLNAEGEQQKKYLLSFRKKNRLPEYSGELFRQQAGYAVK